MIWSCWLKILIFTALTLCIDFVSTSLKGCSIKEHNGIYYSANASKSYGKLLNTSESINKEECHKSCCNLEQCNFLMYSTVLREEERSSNTTCFLFHCAKISKCKTRKVPLNISGESVIGIKQETVRGASLNYTNSTVEQHKIYKPSSNTTDTTTQNTTNILYFNKTHSSNVFSTNIKLKSETIHLSTYVPSNLTESISNTSYPVVSMSSQNTTFSNSGDLTSRIIPSKTIELPFNYNHSSTPSYPITSIHNTNQSIHDTNQLSMLIHSTTLRTHTLGYQPRSNGSSSHVAQLSGSYSNVSNGSQTSRYQNHTLEKTLDTLSMMSVSPWLNSLRSKPDTEIVTSLMSTPSTFVYLPYQTEALSLSTMSSRAFVSRNISSSLSDSVLVSNSSHSTHDAHKTRIPHSKQQIHTTRVSLVISLIIGILFFGTVVFLIGRRWSEQCFRRGYSRVDYLLNDYD